MGAYGVAVGYATALCLLTYPSVAFCLKNSPFTLGDFVELAWRPALSSIMAAAVLFISRSALPNFGNIVFELALKSTLFGVTYGLLWIILPGGRQAIVEILQNLKALGLKRKGRE